MILEYFACILKLFPVSNSQISVGFRFSLDMVGVLALRISKFLATVRVQYKVRINQVPFQIIPNSDNGELDNRD